MTEEDRTMDAATARTALHHWIDQADDAIVIGLATLSAQLKAAIEQKNEQQLQARGRLPTVDPPQTPGEWWASARQRRDEADRQGGGARGGRARAGGVGRVPHGCDRMSRNGPAKSMHPCI